MGVSLIKLLRSDRGANLIEMGLLVILIAIVALVAVSFAGEANSEIWSEIGSGLDQ